MRETIRDYWVGNFGSLVLYLLFSLSAEAMNMSWINLFDSIT